MHLCVYKTSVAQGRLGDICTHKIGIFQQGIIQYRAIHFGVYQAGVAQVGKGQGLPFFYGSFDGMAQVSEMPLEKRLPGFAMGDGDIFQTWLPVGGCTYATILLYVRLIVPLIVVFVLPSQGRLPGCIQCCVEMKRGTY